MSNNMRLMSREVGIILLDNTEVVVRLYALPTNGSWKLLHSATPDLTQFAAHKPVSHFDIIETIANTFHLAHQYHITSWKICARGLSPETLEQVLQVTNYTIEDLTLVREQDLLCRGILAEL